MKTDALTHARPDTEREIADERTKKVRGQVGGAMPQELVGPVAGCCGRQSQMPPETISARPGFHFKSELRQKRPPASAEMLRAIEAEVENAVGGQRARKIVQCPRWMRQIRQDAVAGNEVEIASDD